MSTSLRPNVDVIKVSLPFAKRNEDNFQSSVLELDSKSSVQNRSRPSSAAKSRKPTPLAKPTIQLLGSTVSTATTMMSKFGSPSPKKFSMHTNKSSLSGAASPISTADFTRLNTFSRSGTAFQDKPNINVIDLSVQNNLQSPLVIPKSPKSIGSKSQKAQSDAPKVPEFIPEPELTEAEINERLYKIFQFYASFGERCNVGYLKSHRFSKMMVDAELRDDLLPQSSLDLLFAGELRKAGNLDFDHFVSLLHRVAKAKFEGQISDHQEAYDTVLKNYIFPLFEKIFKDDKIFDEESKAASEPLELSTAMALKLVESTLEQVFKTYFGWELQSATDPQVLRQRLENALFIFLREFGICPDMISKGAAYALYTNIMREEVPQEPQASPNSTPEGAMSPREKTRSSKKNDKEKNLPFGFDRFKLFLVRIANMAYQAPVGSDGEVVVSRHPQMDRTLQLLEKMDVAFRTLNPEKRAALGVTANKTSLLVAQDAIDKITAFLKSKEKVVVIRPNANVVVAPGKRGVLITSGTQYETAGIEDEDVIEVMEKHFASLNKIFQYYCTFGEPMNNSKLQAFKFIKLLREAGIVQDAFLPERSFKILDGVAPSEHTLTVADADIIIATLTGPKQVRELNQKKFGYDTEVASPWIGVLSHLQKSSSLNLAVQNRLDFENYLKAIEMVAAKLYPDAKNMGKAVATVIEKNVLKLEKEVNQVQKAIGSEPLKHLVDLLQNTEVVEFLGVVHKVMMQYYKYYSDSMGMMNLERFIQFCKDFEIFPSIVTKGKLCVFFHALAGVRCQAEETEALRTMDSTNGNRSRTLKKKAIEQTETDLIDQHMFIEALALIANEIPYLNPQPKDIQKISNLMEKLNKSQGPLVVRLDMGVTRHNNGQSWDIMNEIRIRYPELFRFPEDELADEQHMENILESIRKEKC